MKEYILVVILISSLFLFIYADCSYANNIELLVSTKDIQSKTDDFFVDGSVDISLLKDSKEKYKIQYSYSKIGSTGTCSSEDNCNPSSNSILTFFIETGESKIMVSYMCSDIGVYYTYSNGMRDLFCGPKYQLRWNGNKYVIK
jgi:hypothetical protein